MVKNRPAYLCILLTAGATSSSLRHLIDYDHITITDPVVLQRFLVVHQQLAVIGHSDLAGWDSGLYLAKGLRKEDWELVAE